MLLADGRIVGQLLGSCGSNTGDDCDATSNSTIDGAFAVSYPQLERWLNASGTSTPPASTCVPNATTLCLNGNRFQAQVSWRVASQGTAGNGTAISLSGDTGYFWFFSSGNVELVVKALDGRAVNGYFWIFYGALSDVEYTLTVTDAWYRGLQPADAAAIELSVKEAQPFGGNLFASQASTSSGWYPNGPGLPLKTIVPFSSTM